MNNKEEEKSRSWVEENGATIYGIGVFVFLALLVVFMRLFAGG